MFILPVDAAEGKVGNVMEIWTASEFWQDNLSASVKMCLKKRSASWICNAPTKCVAVSSVFKSARGFL